MSRSTALVLGTAAVLCAAFAPARAASPACEAKRANIEAQIAEAEARGHKRRAAGLQEALSANRAHCTDESLAAAREADIRKAEREVAEREEALRAAQRKGDRKKIARQQAKLEEARSELAEASRPILP